MSTVTVTMCHDKISRKRSDDQFVSCSHSSEQGQPESTAQLQWQPEDERCFDQPARTNTNLRLPSRGFKRHLCCEGREGRGAVDMLTEKKKDHSGEKGMHMARPDRRGPPGDGGCIRSPMPTPHTQTRGLVPKWAAASSPPRPRARPRPTTEAAFGKFLKFVWLDDEGGADH